MIGLGLGVKAVAAAETAVAAKIAVISNVPGRISVRIEFVIMGRALGGFGRLVGRPIATNVGVGARVSGAVRVVRNAIDSERCGHRTVLANHTIALFPAHAFREKILNLIQIRRCDQGITDQTVYVCFALLAH